MRKNDYLHDPRLWVVEVMFLDTPGIVEEWMPSSAVGLTRQDAREEAWLFRHKNRGVLTRVRRYYPHPAGE